MAASSPVLTVERLSVTLQRGASVVSALGPVSFQIEAGESVAIVGESGSGKSTLALAVQGLLSEESRPRVRGSVRVAGHEMIAASPAAQRQVRRRHLGAVFQDPMTSLNPTMTIAAQMAERLGEEESAGEWLEKVGVDRAEERLAAYPHQLSGGQRQRVMLAMAMAARPALLVLDEPTTALDVTVQAQILLLLKRVRRENGSAMLFITHDLSVAAAIADRAIVLYRGRIVEMGSVADILSRPRHPYTAALVAARFDLAADRSRPLPTLRLEAAAADASEGCLFRPRCPLADFQCVKEPEATPTNEPGHQAACWNSQRVNLMIWSSDRRASFPEIVGGAAPVLSLAGVRKSFANASATFWRRRHPHIVLEDLDLTVAAGEAVAIVGESGSGKSTILKIAAGLERPDRGERRYAGIGSPQMVFQDAAASLTPWLGVGDLVGERLRGSLRSPAARRAKVIEALARVELASEIANARPPQLSGGQCQRVAIARAIVAPPRLLLCDEPISGVDVSSAAAILNLIGRLRREMDMALLFVTHDLAAARYIADRIVVLERGRIVEQGPSEDVIANPGHEYTKLLIASVPRPYPEAA